jgi:hypothetical protein
MVGREVKFLWFYIEKKETLKQQRKPLPVDPMYLRRAFRWI